MNKLCLVLFLALAVSIAGISCTKSGEQETAEDVSAIPARETAHAADESDSFAAFWKEFQTMKANNDNEGLTAVFTPEFRDQAESLLSLEGMDEHIAKTAAADVEVVSDTVRDFRYIIEYPSDGPETFYSTFGFRFENIDGEWMITDILMAG